MAFKSILDEVESNLGRVLSDMGTADVDFSVEPAKPGFHDATSNVAFLLARHLKKSPREIAQDIAQRYRELPHTLVLRSEAHPSGYVNFAADWKKLSRAILSEARLPEFGSVDIGGGSAVVVEHTSVNPNKALHIGHVRNVVIGDTVARILEKANHRVSVLNYVDDSGLQVADIIVGFKHLGFDPEPPEGKKFDHYCGDDVYVKTTQRYEQDPALEDVRKGVLKGLEDRDSEIARFGNGVTRRVLSAQLETCWNLSASYDCLNFESQIIHSGMWSEIFERLKEMGLVEFEDGGKNRGCWVIRGDGREGSGAAEEDKVIVRSNGTSTYIAKDIPYAAWKLGITDDPFHYSRYEKDQPPPRTLWQTVIAAGSPAGGAQDEDRGGGKRREASRFSGKRVITVIDSRQSRLQKIITDLMGRFKSVPDAYVHLGYESVTLSADTAKALGMETDGRQAQMSGRRGVYVNADSVYDTLKESAFRETKDRNPDMSDPEAEKIAHGIAVGTLRYEMIKQDLDKIIVFDMERSLSMEGDTAPYIQYTCARASRILERSPYAPRPPSPTDVDFSLLSQEHEIGLVRLIGQFDKSVQDAAKNLSPKVIARYCHDLAVSFNSFYEKSKVLDLGDEDLEKARLCLVDAFRTVIRQAMALLGIVSPDRM